MFLLALATTTMVAQDDDLDFSDIPIDEDQIPYIGVGGGYINFITPTLPQELSDFSQSLGLDPFDGSLIIHGGGGWTVIGLIRNIRVGLYTGGGSCTQTKTLPLSVLGPTGAATVPYERSLRYRVDITMGQVDYVIPALFSGFAIIPGIMAGASGHTITVTQTQQGGVSFDQLIGGYEGPDTLTFNNRQTLMLRNHISVYPGVNFEWAANVFVLFRAGVGYHWTFPVGEWKDGEGTTISEVPAIKPDNLMLHLGVFIGLFQK